jgi:hypothetical protein
MWWSYLEYLKGRYIHNFTTFSKQWYMILNIAVSTKWDPHSETCKQNVPPSYDNQSTNVNATNQPRSRVCTLWCCLFWEKYCSNICTSWHRSLALAQAHRTTNNSPHLPTCHGSYLDIAPQKVHFNCTFHNFWNCCHCVSVNPDNYVSAQNTDFIPINTNTDVLILINHLLHTWSMIHVFGSPTQYFP